MAKPSLEKAKLTTMLIQLMMWLSQLQQWELQLLLKPV